MARDGGLWVAPWLKDMICIKDGQVRIFSQRDGLPSATVEQILQAPDGAMWALIGNKLYRQGKDDRWREAFPANLTVVRFPASSSIMRVCCLLPRGVISIICRQAHPSLSGRKRTAAVFPNLPRPRTAVSGPTCFRLKPRYAAFPCPATLPGLFAFRWNRSP